MSVPTRAKAALVLAGVFVLGALVGGAGTATLVRHRIGRMIDGGNDVELRLQMLDHKLHLTREQEGAVRATLERYEPQIRAARAPIASALTELREREASEIRALLAPDQQRRFDEIAERMRRRQRAVIGP